MSGENNEIRISLTLDGKQYIATLNKASSQTAKFVGATQKAAGAVTKTEKPVKHLTGSVDDLNQRLSSARKTFNALGPSAKNYGTALKRVNVLQGHLSNTTGKLNKATTNSKLSFNKLDPQIGHTAYAMLSMNRIIDDSAFGFVAISNNISPMLQSFQMLSRDAGGVKGALFSMGKSLVGPLGIATAVSVVTSLLTRYAMSSSSAKEETKEAAVEMEGLAESTRNYTAALKEALKANRELINDKYRERLVEIADALDDLTKRRDVNFPFFKALKRGDYTQAEVELANARNRGSTQYAKRLKKILILTTEQKRLNDEIKRGITTDVSLYIDEFKKIGAYLKGSGSLMDIPLNAIRSFVSTAKQQFNTIPQSWDSTKLDIVNANGKIIDSFDITRKQVELLDKTLSKVKKKKPKDIFKQFEKQFSKPKDLDLSGDQLDFFNKMKKKYKQAGLPWDSAAQSLILKLSLKLDKASAEKLEREAKAEIGRKVLANKLGLKTDKKGFIIPISTKMEVKDAKPVKQLNKNLDDLQFKADILQTTFSTVGNTIVDAMFGAKVSIGEVTAELGKMIAKMVIMEGFKWLLMLAFPELGAGVNPVISSIFGNPNNSRVGGANTGSEFATSLKNISNNMRYLSNTGRHGSGAVGNVQPIILSADARISRRGLVVGIKRMQDANNRMLRTFSAA